MHSENNHKLKSNTNKVVISALVAQWTEQQPSKLTVVGSSPTEGAGMEALVCDIGHMLLPLGRCKHEK